MRLRRNESLTKSASSSEEKGQVAAGKGLITKAHRVSLAKTSSNKTQGLKIAHHHRTYCPTTLKHWQLALATSLLKRHRSFLHAKQKSLERVMPKPPFIHTLRPMSTALRCRSLERKFLNKGVSLQSQSTGKTRPSEVMP